MKSLQFPSFWTRQQKNDPDDANSLIFNMKLLFWSDGSRDYCRTCGITDSSRRCSVLGCRLLTGTAEEMDFTVEEKCVWLILSVSLPTTHTHTYTHTRACHENMNTHECNLCTCSWSRRHKTTTHAPWCTKDILANHTHTHTLGGSYCNLSTLLLLNQQVGSRSNISFIYFFSHHNLFSHQCYWWRDVSGSLIGTF